MRAEAVPGSGQGQANLQGRQQVRGEHVERREQVQRPRKFYAEIFINTRPQVPAEAVPEAGQHEANLLQRGQGPPELQGRPQGRGERQQAVIKDQLNPNQAIELNQSEDTRISGES